jgi:hypothetical protein
MLTFGLVSNSDFIQLSVTEYIISLGRYDRIINNIYHSLSEKKA